MDTLSECAINLAINGDGTLSLQDYFQPFDYAQYDNYDEDLGSAGLSLLDPGTFSGGGVTQMALTYGKNNIVSLPGSHKQISMQLTKIDVRSQCQQSWRIWSRSIISR